MFAADSGLPTVAELTVERIREALRENIPAGFFDSDPDRYRITNLRYKPGQKLVLSLASAEGRKPVALRFFGPGIASSRFGKARAYHPQHTFLLEELGAVAWVFPGERKLKLGIVEDHDRLSAMLARHRQIALRKTQLVHFVPEHTYTARVEADTADGASVTEYMKIYYDGSGARTASVMAELAAQTNDPRSFIAVPAGSSYISEAKMLLQSALPTEPNVELSNADAARALAAFHGLRARHAGRHIDTDERDFQQAIDMVTLLFPDYRGHLEELRSGIAALGATLDRPSAVLIHGDAHLGNMVPLADRRIGMIDLDGACRGSADQDLATYFAFRLWLRLRAKRPTAGLLDAYPAFLDDYNRFAARPVSLPQAYLRLAVTMVTQRVRRAIARGKLTGRSELASFLDVASRCLELAGCNHA